MHLITTIIFTLLNLHFPAGDTTLTNIPNFELREIVVIEEYSFKNEREEAKYNKMLEDVRKVYPLLQIIKSEYQRINIEMEFYDVDEQKRFLKWYEDYARENYLSLLGGLSLAQGHLLLKLIDRELEQTPYELIRTYRNGFRAIMWQGFALLFFASLDSKYNPEKNPMLEHILKKVESEYEGSVPKDLKKPYFDSKLPYNFK